MATQLAILLRDGMHKPSGYTGAATTFYMLKADQFQVNIAKTPIQIPIPQQSPELIDIGMFRPSITIGGLVDNIGGNTSETTVGYEGMESLSLTLTSSDSALSSSQTYYLPYKNKLEDAAYTWLTNAPQELEIEVGDASRPLATSGSNLSTGGGIYRVAVQQARFQLDPAKEDRWTYTLQFIAKSRTGVDFTC